jgi:hypothetical protein
MEILATAHQVFTLSRTKNRLPKLPPMQISRRRQNSEPLKDRSTNLMPSIPIEESRGRKFALVSGMRDIKAEYPLIQSTCLIPKQQPSLSRPSSAKPRARFCLELTTEPSNQQTNLLHNSNPQIRQSLQSGGLGSKSVIPRLDLSGISAPIQCDFPELPAPITSQMKSVPVQPLDDERQSIKQAEDPELTPGLWPASKTEQPGCQGRGFFAKKKAVPPCQRLASEHAPSSVEANSKLTTAGSLNDQSHVGAYRTASSIEEIGIPGPVKDHKFFVVRKRSAQLGSSKFISSSSNKTPLIVDGPMFQPVTNLQPVLFSVSDPGAERNPVMVGLRSSRPKRRISIMRRDSFDKGASSSHNNSKVFLNGDYLNSNELL